MATLPEWLFYEVMWRAWDRNEAYPVPWWAQQALRHWSDDYDSGLFDSREAAFASNALYRYWNMIGVKDHGLESLIGQAGEIEPIYEAYAVTAFIFEPRQRQLYLPYSPSRDNAVPLVSQAMDEGYLPVTVTEWGTTDGITLRQKAIATTIGRRQRSIVLNRLSVGTTAASARGWLCLAVLPFGPSSFQRYDRAGRFVPDRQISFLRYNRLENRVEVNTGWGPILDREPDFLGLYGNELSSADPEQYLRHNPFRDLITTGSLNGIDTCTDHAGLMCTGVFAWAFDVTPEKSFQIDIRLPIDDFRGGDLGEIRSVGAQQLEADNRTFWNHKLNDQGLQLELPATVGHLWDLFRLCRANLLTLADDGIIHPGPTIYDSFWVRDSSVEAIACAYAGDHGLAATQFGEHYPKVFNQGPGSIGPASAQGFFGGEHEKNDHEWDSNGEALWAIGRFDRASGPGVAFGAKMFAPYLIEGARWIHENRSEFGLLFSGWSAEHLGERDKPHYWDDLWALAGLYEAARLAERNQFTEAQELWNIFDDVRHAVAESLRWVLDQQRAMGWWETFIPTGPADAGRLDSTVIGAVAYFHPCRLYMNQKLGRDIDHAFRLTLETIWAHFTTGGFRHDAAWHAYGPYLTLQLAHAFLLVGDIDRMDRCLQWAVGNAAYSTVAREHAGSGRWEVVQGAWNEQHAYPISSDFSENPGRWWYMGDIPHGWAAAEFNMLLRDIVFFEADEDVDPHIYLAPGIPNHWLANGTTMTIKDAPTVFGSLFGFTLDHDAAERTVTITITQSMPANIRYIYHCRLGTVTSAVADGLPVSVEDEHVALPGGSARAVIQYI